MQGFFLINLKNKMRTKTKKTRALPPVKPKNKSRVPRKHRAKTGEVTVGEVHVINELRRTLMGRYGNKMHQECKVKGQVWGPKIGEDE
jgi:hypothetical protein